MPAPVGFSANFSLFGGSLEALPRRWALPGTAYAPRSNRLVAAPNFRGSYRDILQVRACLNPIQSFTIFESFLASQKSISLVTPFNPNPLPLFRDAKHDSPQRRRLAHCKNVYVAPPSSHCPPVVSNPIEPTVSNFESIDNDILDSTFELIQIFKDPSCSCSCSCSYKG